MDKAARFRRESDKRFGNRKRRGHYPDALKSLALEHMSAVLAGGGMLKDAAKDLGVDVNSLRTWRNAAEHKGKPGVMRRMRIVEDARSAVYVVHAPGDLRIECSDADSVADLLRALR